MQLPLVLLRRGLLGFMDEQDKPRGLFDLFGGDDDGDSSTDDGVDREAQARWATDPAFQDSRIEEFRGPLVPSDPQRWDPAALPFLRQLKAVGDGFWTGPANAPSLGPRAFRFRGGPIRVGSPPGAGIAAPLPPAGLLPGSPQGKPADSPASSPPHRDDAEATPQPGSDFLFGGPPSRTAENTEVQVYHLPPKDGREESSEEEAERKSQEERAAAKAKENWEAWCDRQWDKERQICEYKFSYDDSELAKCQDRAFKRYKSCLKDDDEYVGQWTDALANGGFKPKTPYQKRLEKWKRPRAKPR